MKIVHTSDWHLGQFFYARSRAAEHQAFFQWLKALVIDQGVEAIIVAGDIFDTATPASYARELLNQFIVSLQETGCQLYLLAGNHDSVATLNESRELVACLNTHIITGPTEQADSPIFPLTDRQGNVAAILCAIPYLRPRDIQLSQAGLSGREKQQDLLHAITGYYHDIFQQARDYSQQHQFDERPIIVTGHLTALGVSKSDSVRDIYIGSLEAFPASAFPPADYIALGHIHRPQNVSGDKPIRYSGSPIPLSFDELGSSKSITLITLTTGEPLQWQTVDIPCFQPMRGLKGTLNELADQLAALEPPTNGQKIWLDIEIHHEEYLSDLQQRVEKMTAGLAVEILLLRRKRIQSPLALSTKVKETLSELTPEEVFRRRLAQEPLDDDQYQILLQRFREVSAQLDEAQG
ncbi:Exodeoxyribonuclease I subunit D [Rosenbergiella nectarea]|uniref:Nuclease SbcCD subunit D n=1 Tax=Rosenbergiella nectarea TaxID=988801 RepID=A0A1H9IKQ6_9GAMM|nr:exonuclease subunit SbcD [Rosenbergiella nectarea]SEQ75136.1 Exodeoxyribonuclease I subunit D [Rosenbergiella nectarea]